MCEISHFAQPLIEETSGDRVFQAFARAVAGGIDLASDVTRFIVLRHNRKSGKKTKETL